MYTFSCKGKKSGGPVATRSAALSMALHIANRSDSSVTVNCPDGEQLLVEPSAED